MNRTCPKISIVIPSYNQGNYIEETLCSIIKQDYPNLEIIVIDGGSTDNTVQILQQYSRNITYWESQPDKGQAHAINKGFARATGEIIGWINSDDFYLDGYLKLVGKTFSLNSDIQIVYANSVTLDERDGITYKEYGHLTFESFLVFGGIIPSHTTFWRKEIHKDLDESINCAVDYELWLRLFPGKKWKHLHYFGGVFRLQNSSKSMGGKGIFMQKWADDSNYIKKKHQLSSPSLTITRAYQFFTFIYRRYSSLRCKNHQSVSGIS